MRYNFDKLTNRLGTNSIKWDRNPDVLPMWIADMDFEVAPCIVDAMKRKADERIFGYTEIPDSYYKSLNEWFTRRRGWSINKEWVNVVQGIVPAIAITVAALAKEGGKVLVQSPAYPCFFKAIVNQGRKIFGNDLVYDSETHRFSVDFEDFERKCSDPDCNLFLLCNPQNPTGRMWSREELTRMGEIALKHGVTVISDEIHCELEMPGHKYTPYATLRPELVANSVSFCSPTKGFNIAGLQVSNIVCSNPELRAKIEAVINKWQHCDMNQIGIVALQAAYTEEGEEWLKEANEYIWGNYCALKDKFEKELPNFPVTQLEATYLVWVNCKALEGRFTSKQIEESLVENEKVWVNNGEMYDGEGFIRVNIACPRERMLEGVSRIIKGLKRLDSESR